MYRAIIKPSIEPLLKPVVSSLIKFFTLVLLFHTLSAQAEILQFNVGDGATYNISTQRKIHNPLKGIPLINSSKTDLNLELKILSSNPETLSYPFEVEVVFKDLNTIEESGEGITTVFNTQTLETPQNIHLVKFLHHLLNQPLYFKINENAIEAPIEPVRQLAHALRNTYLTAENTEVVHFEFIFEDLTEFLARLFHLSTQDLHESLSYPVPSPLQDSGLSTQNSLYTIHEVDGDTLHGLFTFEGDLQNFHITVREEVEWNCFQPLLQNRYLFGEAKTHEAKHAIQENHWIQQTCEAYPLYTEETLVYIPELPVELEEKERGVEILLTPDEVNVETLETPLPV